MDAREIQYAAALGPFQRLSEDEWRLILHQMDDTTDIDNLLDALPELAALTLQGQQFSLLIGRIIPLIFPKHLDFQDFRNCRLVSKRWMNAMGNSVENHPDRIPYNSTRMTNVCGTSDFSHHSLSAISTNFDTFVKNGSGSSFGVSGDWNPFPGRQLVVRIANRYGVDVGGREALEALRAFGKHVWYLNVVFYGPPWFVDGRAMSCHTRGLLKVARLTPKQGDDMEYFKQSLLQPFLNLLGYLPNLKSLKVVRSWGPRQQQKNLNTMMDTAVITAKIPFRLETLDLSGFECLSEDVHAYFVKLFVYHDNVHKFGVRHRSWNDNYGTLFPNLTELYINSFYSNRRVDDVQQILKSLQAPNLRKLKITNGPAFLNIGVVLEALQGEHIECLELVGKLLEDDCQLPNFILPSIRKFTFATEGNHSFKFLKALPSLEHLTIEPYYYGWPMPAEQVPGAGALYNAVRKLQFGDRDGWNVFGEIWEEMPALKMLTVRNGTDKPKKYIRECKGAVFFCAQ